MGTRVVAIARGTDKQELAHRLGAHHYIDSSAVNPGAALQALGGARVILATAANGASMSALVDGLTVRGRMMVIGAAADPIEVSTGSLIFGGRTIEGSLTGTPADNEDNLAFSVAQDMRPIIETVSLAQAGPVCAHAVGLRPIPDGAHGLLNTATDGPLVVGTAVSRDRRHGPDSWLRCAGCRRSRRSASAGSGSWWCRRIRIGRRRWRRHESATNFRTR
jgi:NADPH:quinone reductase-like Zn-dependent oxidoreductase